jgi:hypothetical protein
MDRIFFQLNTFGKSLCSISLTRRWVCVLNMLGVIACYGNSSFYTTNNMAHRAICIKCYDFERHMNSSNHFVALSQVPINSSNHHYFVLFWYNFTDLLRDLSFYSGYFYLSLSDELGDCTDRPIFWNSCCGRCCWAGCCTLLPAVCGACGCCCWVSWHNAAA